MEKGLTLTHRKQTTNVESLKYLGSTMTTNCNCSADIRVRTSTALKVMNDIDNVWKEQGNENEINQRAHSSHCVV